MDNLKLNLCQGCVEDLQDYNPYIFKDGTPRPLDSLDITVVPITMCANKLIENEYFEKENEENENGF